MLLNVCVIQNTEIEEVGCSKVLTSRQLLNQNVIIIRKSLSITKDIHLYCVAFL